jgi:ribonuclease HI
LDFEISKKENENLLISKVREHIGYNYSNHLKIFTDGSVLNSKQCGSGFVIPDLKIQKSYNLGQGFSIFTAELYAIFNALLWINNSNLPLFNILVCVDSKAALYALKSWDFNVRKDMIYEIKFLIHSIISKGTGITFCWVPSHCGFYWNEISDELAKKGALNIDTQFVISDVTPSHHEIITNIQRLFYKEYDLVKNSIISAPRHLGSLVYKFRLNAWKTKYSKNISCICRPAEKITIHHILFECPVVKALLKDSGFNLSAHFNCVKDFLSSSDSFVLSILHIISNSSLGKLL